MPDLYIVESIFIMYFLISLLSYKYYYHTYLTLLLVRPALVNNFVIMNDKSWGKANLSIKCKET